MIDPVPQIIVLHGKHEPGYYDASTPDLWARSCLEIMRELDEDGYYWTNDEDEDFVPVDTENIPSPYKEEAERDNRRGRARVAAVKEANALVLAIKECLATADTSMVVTTNRRNVFGEEPKAWQLLVRRSDYEYERVELISLWSARNEE
jgi:hypothetical protein